MNRGRFAINVALLTSMGSIAWIGTPVLADGGSQPTQAATTHGGTTSSPTTLQGQVDSTVRVQPSVLVTPTLPNKPPLQSQIRQYAAGGTYTPGQPAPIPPKPKPKPVVLPANAVANVVAVPPPVPKIVAPPKFSFTLTPRNGIMSWQPGHGVKLVPQAVKPVFVSNAVSSRLTTPSLLGTRTVLPSPAVQPLLAVPLALPQVQQLNEAQHTLTWDEWYERISGAIYQQWQRARVCPGEATVHVIVFRSRSVDCQVKEFNPAIDVTRDSGQEGAFRQAAIRAVYALNKCQILEFPYSSRRQKIEFEMDFKRAIDGPQGCRVAPIHDVEDLPAISRQAPHSDSVPKKL